MNGLNNPSQSLFGRLLSKYQLIAIQETKFSKPDHLQSSNYFVHTVDAKARCFWSHTASSNFNGRHGVGVIVSSSCPLQDVENVTQELCEPALWDRYLLIKAKLNDARVYVHVVYAPDEPAQRAVFFEKLPRNFLSTAAHVALGDFNVTIDTQLDQISNTHHAGVGRPALSDWLTTVGLLDAWRFTNPEVREFTSPTRRNRLDYCFLSLGLLQDNLEAVSHVYTEKWHHEDHAPVDVLLSAHQLPRLKKSPWRCPPWLLALPTVQEFLQASVVKLATRIRVFPGDNPGCLLDEHKRSDCIYLKDQLRLTRNADVRQMQELLQAVQDAQDQLNIRPTDENHDHLTACRLAVKAHQDAVQHRNQFRKFAHDLETSERATSEFFKPPVPERLRVPITETLLETGTRTRDPTLAAEAHRLYWGELFQSPSEDLRSQRTASYQPLQLLDFLKPTTARVSAGHQSYLDAPLTANDFYWAITSSKKNKAPGPDGLPIEYYQVATHEWAKIYEVVYASQFRKQRMSKFQRRVHLALLYKAGDRAVPSNYRPLTLLNHDAKLGPKILAYRLRTVMPTLVHDDQTGFVHGRSIRHSLLRFQDLQHTARLDHPDGGAVLLDFAKAFDSVLWPALQLVLQHFGFGANFCAWIQTFYHETSVSILMNNVPGRPFELGAGVRQGDPLSPALFVLFIEPMMNYLRLHCGNDGIPCPTSVTPHHLVAFADDCTGILQDLRQAPRFLEHVQRYSAAAGMKLNVSKTCILPFTTSVSTALLTELRDALGVRVLGPRETVKLLGILQGASITDQERFEPLLEQMRSRCVLWKYRARTMFGRISILRSIILPLLWYTTSVTATPKWVYTAADIIIRNFVNMNAPDNKAPPGMMNKEWIYANVSDGGLGLTHPEAFVRASHLVCLRDSLKHVAKTSTSARWSEPSLALYTRSMNGLGYGFDILYATSVSDWKVLPEFWLSTLRLWGKLQRSVGTCAWRLHVQELPFWDNLHMLYGKTKRPLHDLSVSSPTLVRTGVTRLQDFVLSDGEFPTAITVSSRLPDESFARPASKTRFVNDFCKRLSLIIPETPPTLGPHLPVHLGSALHSWQLDGQLVIDMSNSAFTKLLKVNAVVPLLPFGQMGISGDDLPVVDWALERTLDRHLLPVCADVKFRAQHNAMGFRYKFQWRTQVQADSSKECIHGCTSLETCQHLFWYCAVAGYQWDFFLKPFHGIFHGRITWQGVLYPTTVSLRQTATTRYGTREVLEVFNVVRSCVFRSLWLHRNKKLYNPDAVTSKEFVRHHASAYIRLHLRVLRTHAEDRNLTRLQTLLAAVGDCYTAARNQGESPSTLHQSS